MNYELRDRIAKAIADIIGHGMREKCYAQADAAIAALTSPATQGAAVAVAFVDIGPDGIAYETNRDTRGLRKELGEGRHALYTAPAAPPRDVVIVPRLFLERLASLRNSDLDDDSELRRLENLTAQAWEWTRESCRACNRAGIFHCGEPDRCGNMKPAGASPATEQAGAEQSGVVALLGFPEGERPAHDLIYPGATKLPGYRYTPVYSIDGHPDVRKPAPVGADAVERVSDADSLLAHLVGNPSFGRWWDNLNEPESETFMHALARALRDTSAATQEGGAPNTNGGQE